MKNRSLLLATTVLIAGFASQSAYAQTAAAQDGFGLEEVVVTARKRAESIQDIPVSITAFSEKAIETAAIFDVKDVTRLAPNVVLQQTGGAGTGRFMPNLTFRGLQNVFPQPRAQVGAVFVDGNFVLGGVNAVNTADVERVEVLRGPQNAYFGRNTFAGAINFITKTPGNEFKAELGAQASVRQTYIVNAAIETPIIEDKLAMRLSLFSRDKRGHYVARDGGRMGDEGTQSVGLTLYATPTDKLWIRVRAGYQRDDDGPGTIVNLSPALLGDTCRGQRIDKGTTLAGARGFNVSLPYFCGSIPGLKQLGTSFVSTNTQIASPLLASLGRPNALAEGFLGNSLNDGQWAKAPKPDGLGLQREIKSINLQTQYELFSGITFAFNYGFEENYQSLLFDSDRTDTEVSYSYAPQFSRVQMFEARLRSGQDQRFRWLLGAAAFDSHFASNFGNGGALQYVSRALATQPFRTGVLRSSDLGANPYSTNEVAHVRSAFGAVDFDVWDQLTVTGELRYQVDKSKSGGTLLPLFPGIPQEITFKDWAPRVIATYKPTQDWNLYASFSRGVLPGVENSGYTSQTEFRKNLIRQIVPNIEPILDSDHLDSYEIGSKQTLFGGRLRYNLAAYYMKWKNAKSQTAIIVPASSPTDPTPVTTFATTSGTVEAYGLELEAALLLTRKWEVAGGMSLQKSRFLKWGEAGLLRDLTGGQSPGAVAGNVAFGAINWEGNEMQRQPRATFNLNSTYRDTLAGDWEWFARGEVNYTGRAWDSTANIVKSSDYFRVNARVGFENNNVKFEFYVLNLFNDKTWDYISRTNVVNTTGGSQLSVLPIGNTGYLAGIAAQAPDLRDFGVRVNYKF